MAQDSVNYLLTMLLFVGEQIKQAAAFSVNLFTSRNPLFCAASSNTFHCIYGCLAGFSCCAALAFASAILACRTDTSGSAPVSGIASGSNGPDRPRGLRTTAR